MQPDEPTVSDASIEDPKVEAARLAAARVREAAAALAAFRAMSPGSASRVQREVLGLVLLDVKLQRRDVAILAGLSDQLIAIEEVAGELTPASALHSLTQPGRGLQADPPPEAGR